MTYCIICFKETGKKDSVALYWCGAGFCKKHKADAYKGRTIAAARIARQQAARDAARKLEHPKEYTRAKNNSGQITGGYSEFVYTPHR